MGDVSVEVAVHVGAQHGEGPMWDAATARLWWVDIAGMQVHCFDPAAPAGREDRAWSVTAPPGGVVIDTRGEPIIAMPDGLAGLDRGTGSVSLYVPIEPDQPENRANDAKVDSRGRVWVGTMAFDKRPGHAALYRVDGDVVTRVVDGITISNGPAFDDANGRLYLADTGAGIVDVFELDLDSGELRDRRRFLDFRDAGWWPDGMTVDDEGLLWLALGRAGAVHRYGRDGELRGVVELPTSNPTSIAFGGSDARDLYITTSWTDLDARDRASQPLAGAVLRCRPGVSGRPSPRYRRPQASP